MASDVPLLHPTNSSIVSYAMHGKSYDATIPEWRIVANTPWSELWQGLNGLMSHACMGLMSNQTALDMMKVWLPVLSLVSLYTTNPALPALQSY